ncbi:AbrB family transcriptional regulator [Sphingomonas taxi]|uniref:AbrB family transcriptional regulator n=1 Tax=Sphingomonas taxi TaxID=1549858 RepID=A0A097ECM0_9SPHN|nr:AbrB/MazE/SpoVT family DNA-binding domain-containing protein [Sphingomonas taxi]AIT05320.1 AbrB family transcriptional regulator [Sphingomonas taxi]
MAEPARHRDIRVAQLFRNNRSQAVRIPAEFEFSGSRVLIHKEGDRLIIEPEPQPNLLDKLRSLSSLDPADGLPDDLDNALLPLKDTDL